MRFKFAGTDALLRLHKALADDDQAALESLQNYFLESGSLFTNNLELAGLATERLAQLNHDSAKLAQARAMMEKSLVKLRSADSWADDIRMTVSADLIRIKLLQANAAGGAAGDGLIREALADDDRFMRKFADQLPPDNVLGLRQRRAELTAGLAGDARFEPALVQTIADYEGLLAQASHPREQWGNRIKLASMLISLSSLQTRDNAIASAKRARAIVQHELEQVGALTRDYSKGSQLNQLAGNLTGAWQVSSRFVNGCTIDATLRVALAQADLVLAADAQETRAAGLRLLEADARLAETPAYRRNPDPLIFAASWFLSSSNSAPPTAKSDLRQKAAATLDEAQRRVDHCFCGFSQGKITTLRAELDRVPH